MNEKQKNLVLNFNEFYDHNRPLTNPDRSFEHRDLFFTILSQAFGVLQALSFCLVSWHIFCVLGLFTTQNNSYETKRLLKEWLWYGWGTVPLFSWNKNAYSLQRNYKFILYKNYTVILSFAFPLRLSALALR